MKIFKILLVVAIALGMVACNNEDVPQLPDGPEASVSVRVVPSSNGPAVRLAGDLSDPIAGAIAVAESNIKKLEVFIFHRASGLANGYGVASPAVGETTVTEVKNIETTAGPKNIYVVANASIIGPVLNENDLLGQTSDVTVINVTTNGLPMTSGKVEASLVAGHNYYGYTQSQVDNITEANGLIKTKLGNDLPVPLTRVNARVAIVSATLSSSLPPDQAAVFDGLENIQVAMFNVPKISKLFGAPLFDATGSLPFLFGAPWPTTLSSYVEVADGGVVNGSYFAEGSLVAPLGFGSSITNINAPYFYVTENAASANKQQMLIVLRAKPTKGGTTFIAEGLYTDVSGFTYYPVWVNADKTGYIYTGDATLKDSKILRNTQYNITLKINGIGNPTIDPAVDVKLDVIVSVEAWKVVNQEVTWN